MWDQIAQDSDPQGRGGMRGSGLGGGHSHSRARSAALRCKEGRDGLLTVLESTQDLCATEGKQRALRVLKCRHTALRRGQGASNCPGAGGAPPLWSAAGHLARGEGGGAAHTSE